MRGSGKLLWLPLGAFLLGAALSPGHCRADEAEVRIEIDHAAVLRLDRPAALIILGNPAIADAAIEDGRILILTGKSAGRTNIIAMDADGREIMRGALLVAASESGRVALFLGARRRSYHCAPLCEAAPAAGDDPAHFDETAGANAKRLDLARKAGAGKE